jgi:hypothetical protein
MEKETKSLIKDYMLKAGQPNKKTLDDLCRKIVKLRDRKCCVCGSTSYLQTAHFITRSNYAVRWDLDNIWLLCSGCHLMRRNSWHKDPASASEWVRNVLGEDRYNNLRMRASTVGQKIDKNTVLLYLKQEKRRIENGRK